LSDVLFKNLKARSIGPAVMGGRVSDIAIDPRNPFVFYVALGHGGVFKSGDSGVSFDPIFDKQSALSIGAIAIAPSDSDVIWVGSGEANDRNSSDWGDGVYRTTDGSEQFANSLRSTLREAADTLEFHFWTERHEWRRRRWNLQTHKRRCDLEKIKRRFAGANRANWSRR
jgi:hypothetical protein